MIARKVGEAVQNTFGAVVGAIDIPLGEHEMCQQEPKQPPQQQKY